ncbi:MAG: stalk domain-containing protein, partial [Syntrophomonas sp.]
VYAVSSAKTIKAYQGIKIVYNGQELTDSTQPYVINNTTFVPLRILMNYFGKAVTWDAVNSRVLITDDSSSLKEQLAQKDAQIKTLQSQITQLNSKISNLEDDNDLSDIEDTLNNYFEDRADDYFDDAGIDVIISLDGDEDDITYLIKLDFDDADDYNYLTDISQTDLKTFLNAVKSKINSEIEDTDYEDADLTGKMVDDNYSSYYVKYNGSSYTFSWDNTDLSDIEDTLSDYFEDAGYNYFDDDGIDVTISLDGDEDDIEYTIELGFDDADDYSDLTDVSETDLKSFLNAVKSKINSEIEDTEYEDASISGELKDNDTSSYYVEYSNGSYSFSWD